MPCDVRRLDDVQNLVKATVQRFGVIHILVNNAGSVRAQSLPMWTMRNGIRCWRVNCLAISA